MPELPEVETTLQALVPHIQGARIKQVVVRCQRLRWPIADDLDNWLHGQSIHALSRRGKYLLMHLDQGTLIIHLGMSGRLSLFNEMQPPKRHDHVDIIFTNQSVLRYTDPRRFGAILMTTDCPKEHPLLKQLGVEPLTGQFTADYLMKRAENRRVAIKPFIMDSKIVVGIGNIYSAEALFLAGIHPFKQAGLVTQNQMLRLIDAIKQVLTIAITKGGTTLKDFVNPEGRPGYFAQQLNVYGRGGLPCRLCNRTLKSCILGQRATVYCIDCQPDES